jgi:hypothetical protein
MVLKRIGVLSMAKIAGVLYAAIGVFVGLGVAVLSSVAGMAGARMNPDMPGWAGPLFGVGAIVVLPILYGILGFIGGAIGAGIYNVFSGIVGGLELELEAPAGRIAV